MFVEIGKEASSFEVGEIIKFFDKDRDKALSKAEFTEWMKNP